VEPRAIPILPALDLAATLAFYERLGFRQAGAPWQTYDYLIVVRDRYELHFFAQPELDPLATATGCYLRVDDADAWHDEWNRAGISPDRATGSRLLPVEDTDYGMREFALVDPNGNLVRVGSEP
jgi:catechol 2,3-dioxygenase-like lactoylglutathione lyase family enzyme